MKQSSIIIFLLFVCGNLSSQSWIKLSAKKGIKFESVSQSVVSELEGRKDATSKRQYKQFKRWELHNEDHINADGTLGNFSAINQKAFKKLKKKLAGPLKANFGEWESVSTSSINQTAPWYGRVNAIEVHPANSNIIYVGTPFGGLWKTVDGGLNWTPLTDGLPTIGISDIAIHPANNNVIYILTGDGDAAHTPSVGILKSTDGGLNWQETDLSFDLDQKTYGYNIATDPNDPDKMFVTMRNGIYRTDNGWFTSQRIDSSASFRDIEYKPGSSDTIYATSNNSVFRSVDGGISFDNLSDNSIGLPTDDQYDRVGLGLTPADPDAVYFIYCRSTSFEGLYYSASGDTFTLMSSAPNIASAQAHRDLDILVDNTNPGIVYVGSLRMYKSTDFGATWSHIANGAGLPSIHVDIHRIVQDGSVIYAGTDGGISKSVDGGSTWTNISEGLKIMQYYDICIDGDRRMGGTQDNGSMLWEQPDLEADVVLGGDGCECIFDHRDPNVIYASSQDSREISIDGGQSFNIITPFNETSHWDAPWIMHPTNTDTLYAANKSLYRSYNQGSNWIDMTPPGGDKKIFGLAQSPSDPDIIYAARHHMVAKTENANSPQLIWTDVTSNLPANLDVFRGLTIDDADPNKVWIALAGYADTSKVYVTHNGGTSWTNITDSLPNVPVYCILHEPGSNNDGIYIGTDLGVFYRNDDLGDWIFYSNGLPVTSVRDLEIHNNNLYAGTFGRGMWKAPLYNPNCVFFHNLTPANDPSNPNSTGVQIYEASSHILSTREIVGGVGTDVLYKAGNYIRLDPGFEAKIHSQLTAKIEGCQQ